MRMFRPPLLWLFGVSVLAFEPNLFAQLADCNANGVDDARDVFLGRAGVQRVEEHAIAPQGEALLLEPADFNADGSLDFAVSDAWAPSMTLFLGRADGTYAQTAYKLSFRATSLVARDLNGDGRVDLAQGGESRSIVLENDAQGRLAATPDASVALGGYPLTLLAEDFDGDGAADLAGPTGGGFGIAFNAGDGTFAAPVRVDLEGQIISKTSSPDLDADGLPDLLLGARAGLFLAHNEGDRRFSPPAQLAPGAIAGLAPNDLDQDGNVDALVADLPVGRANNLTLLWNNGTGQPSAWEAEPIPVVVSTHLVYPEAVVAVGDFDGNGRLDFTAIKAGGIAVFHGRGDRSFSRAADIRLASTPFTILSNDLNRDGKDDLATANVFTDDVISLALSRGESFAPPEHLKATRAREPSVHTYHFAMLAAVDLEGDGAPELVRLGKEYPQGVLQVAHTGLGVGPEDPGTNDGSVDINENGVPDECENLFRRGDSNGDGQVNITDSIYTLRYLFLGGAAPGCFDAADVDDSGALDLSDGHSINVFLFLGRISLAPPGPFRCGSDPTIDDALLCVQSTACP